jgi:predicted  nucleic acid-binding Zn ribbon protein
LLDKIPEGLNFEAWSTVHNHIYEIWLASGLLEKWAEKQLGKYNSQLNKDLLKLIKRVKKINGIPIYYQLWQATYDDKNSCPSCKDKGIKTKLKKPKYACSNCYLAFGY